MGQIVITVLPTIGRTRAGFRVRYRENGALREEILPTLEEARARQDVLMERAAESVPDPVKIDGTGEPEDWSRVLWETAAQVLASPDMRPERKAVAVASLAKAAHGFVDMRKMRALVTEVKRQVGEIRQLRKDGVRTSPRAGAPAEPAPAPEPLQ